MASSDDILMESEPEHHGNRNELSNSAKMILGFFFQVPTQRHMLCLFQTRAWSSLISHVMVLLQTRAWSSNITCHGIVLNKGMEFSNITCQKYNKFDYSPLSRTKKIKMRIMMFNATFNNISVIPWRSVL
jgi:hypothetical protein